MHLVSLLAILQRGNGTPALVRFMYGLLFFLAGLDGLVASVGMNDSQRSHHLNQYVELVLHAVQLFLDEVCALFPSCKRGKHL